MESNAKPKAIILSKIFNTEIPENYTDDDLYAAQLSYLTSETFNIEKLISLYSAAPRPIVETLLLFHDSPEITKSQTFPFSFFSKLLSDGGFDKISLVQHLCELREDIFINVLYSIGYFDQTETMKSINDLRVLLSFKGCWKYLENSALWGLNRPKVGVYSPFDKYILSMVKNRNLDITKINSMLENPYTRPYFEHATTQDVPYMFPLFLQPAFEAILGFTDDIKLSAHDIPVINNVLNLIYEMISPLLSNPMIKNNFCDLIKNVYSQDRVKHQFDYKTNCSDSLCYVLCDLLIKVVQRTFCDSFIYQIDDKKFLTFCFFYISRMMEISIFRMYHDHLEGYNSSNLSFLFAVMRPGCVKYLNFVYSVVITRKNEVFDIIVAKARELEDNEISDVNAFFEWPGILSISLDDTKATCVKEILLDSSLIKTIVTIQELYQSRNVKKDEIMFLEALLGYKNTFRHDVLRILRISGSPLSSVALKRLVIFYNEKNPDIISDRIMIQEIIKTYVLEPNKYTLRMVTLSVGYLEEMFSMTFNTIKSLISLNEKGLMLQTALDNEEEITVSDDEGDSGTRWQSVISQLSNHTDAQLLALIRRQTSNDEEVNREFKEIKTQIKLKERPLLLKLYRKIKFNSANIQYEKKRLTSYALSLNSILQFLHSFTAINKKLFLNKHIFFRMFSIVNSGFNLLVGDESLKIRLPHKEDYNFNPKDILASILKIVINILKGNMKLIEASCLDKPLFRRALDLAKNKFLVNDESITVLVDICEALPDMAAIQTIDEDIPEEFLDPLTFIMMKDPVILLTSKITVDRSTFNQIMLNDQTDPFSRLPLDESKIVENGELKERIEAFISGSGDVV